MNLAELKKLPEAWFVAAVWALTTGAILRFVYVFGVNFPQWDDFAHVPVLTHAQPLSLEWLWAAHNEHRIPLGKLTWVLTSALTQGNYRVPMFLSAVLLSVASAAFIYAVIRERGSVRYSDAVPALLLLNLVQVENLVWGHQVVFAASVAFPLLFAAVALAAPRALNTQGILACASWGWGMGAAMFLGAASTLFAFRAFRYRDASPAFRRQCVAWSVVLLLLFGSYVLSYHVVPDHEGHRTVQLLAGYFARLLGDALVADAGAWPVASIFVVLTIIMTAIAVDLRRLARGMDGALALIGFVVLVCLVVTWGRAQLGIDQAFSSRYATLVAPLLCGCYALAALSSRTTKLTELVSTLLIVISSAAYAYGAGIGINAGRARRDGLSTAALSALTNDPLTTAIQHSGNLFPDVVMLTTFLEQLREARLAVFAHPDSIKRLQRHALRPMPLGVTPAPSRVTAAGIEADSSLGEPGLLAHAPSSMAIDLPAGSYALHGLFGFRPGAYNADGTDGADFIIAVDDGERRQLWTQSLHPREVVEDRGPHEVALALELTQPGRLLLETMPGPSDSSSYDWTVWAGVQVTPR